MTKKLKFLGGVRHSELDKEILEPNKGALNLIPTDGGKEIIVTDRKGIKLLSDFPNRFEFVDDIVKKKKKKRSSRKKQVKKPPEDKMIKDDEVKTK